MESNLYPRNQSLFLILSLAESAAIKRSHTELKFRSTLRMKSAGSLADSALSPSQQVECFCA